jgi:serine/threonine protein kinase
VKESDDKTLLSDGDADAPTKPDGDESYCAACGASYPMDIDVCPKDGARLTKLKAQPDALLGRVFDGRFEVRTSLGQGGMGTVYRGWQITVDREIAIKVIHPKLASDRIAVKRFLREARLSSRLNQPNIVNVYDFGQTEDGILYIAMELLRGHTLGRELESMRPLTTRRVLGIAQQLCDALDSAHNQGIVHRDLKPNNIIILDDPPGRDLIKVLDFGLAKSLITDTSSLVTNTNAILGTPLYMPPEQIEGKASDQRADLYSLGCILFQMLTGRPPFTGETVNVVLAAHVSDPVPPLPQTVPAPLAKMVLQLMEKEPAKRMGSAREAREVMQSVLEAGYPTSEVYDTTPDIRPRSLDTGPIALAETHAATSASSPRVAAPVTSEITQVPSSRFRWLAPGLLAAVASGAIMFTLMRKPERTDSKPAPVVVPIAVDAQAVEIDAMIVLDAYVVDAAMPPPDAPKKKKGQTTPKTVARPDAGAPVVPAEPTLDFIKRDAGT